MFAKSGLNYPKSVEEGGNARRVGHGGQGKKVLVALYLDAHGRRFDGAVLQFQIPATTDSHLALANSIYYGRRKLHELGEMTNVWFLFNQQSQEESRWQAERLSSNISET